MADRGHPDFPLDPRYPSDPAVGTAVSTDYGVLDPDTARRWGYGWDPAQHPVPRPKGRRMTSSEYADWPTCNADATRRLMRGIDVTRDWLYAGRRAAEVDKAVQRDPRVREAWDVWSRCVAAQGFARYSDPAAAYTDDAWQRGSDGNTRHSQRKRATAVADVTCKRRHRTVELWHAVRARKQSADITRHRDRYATGLQALRTYRANIAEVLRKLGQGARFEVLPRRRRGLPCLLLTGRSARSGLFREPAIDAERSRRRWPVRGGDPCGALRQRCLRALVNASSR
ncbi:hypothetical protein [Streptomyces sp. SID2888]|uniref:hypothetical protein n=1 Tax=Streptomyces sp. SID2888 TaxID=2690256 RepID=UPI001F421654|nr:hypothetical protein [Streptomyces sp. SID2888]